MTKSRVIIENVQPQVEGGLYPAKRTINERIDVSANIFADGHDHIRAQVRYRAEQDTLWTTEVLQHKGNDEWATSFYPKVQGKYLIQIVAWIDHFETWYDGFQKKTQAKLDVHVELLEGATFLKRLSSGKDELEKLAISLQNTKDYTRNIETVLSDSFGELVKRYSLIENETISDKTYIIEVEHHKALFSTWYELFPRSASLDGKHGTFADVVKLLPRIASMGFDVLYMPPIHPIGKVNRKGKNNNARSEKGEPGSPWAIGSEEGGHKAIHPDLGTLQSYKNLIQEAKSHGIDIGFDLAFQCAPDHPYVTEHPEWFKQRPDGTIQYAENPPKKYQDIYPFYFECEQWEELWQELKSVILFWIEQGVRIFRVDNPHTKPIQFWQWCIGEVNKEHKDVIFLAEAFTRPKIMASLAKVGFTQSYTYFTWRVTKNELIDYMTELVNSPSRNYFRPNFWPTTPDILPYHLHNQGENAFIIRLALAATLASNYGIYGAAFELLDNTSWNGREEFNDSEKYEIKQYPWKRTNRMTDIITLLNGARKENPALQNTWNIQFLTVENPNLLAYIKATDDLSNIVLVVVNLDPNSRQSGYVQLPKERLKMESSFNVKLHEVIMNELYTWTQEWNYVELDPFKMPFHLFVLRINESNM